MWIKKISNSNRIQYNIFGIDKNSLINKGRLKIGKFGINIYKFRLNFKLVNKI